MDLARKRYRLWQSHSLFGLASYVWDSPDFEVPDAVYSASHTVLDALVNTRSQCESLAKEAGLYSDKKGGWIYIMVGLYHSVWIIGLGTLGDKKGG